jgi:capsular exopolysaccharide synthesis family protein
MRSAIFKVNERAIKYAMLKNEAEANQDLYSNLLAKLKEAGISAGLKSSNIHVVDQARVLDSPTRPNRRLNIAFGFIGGILGGVMLALVIEKLDNTVHTPDDVTECTGFPSLALFPLEGSTNGKGLLSPWHERALKLLGNGSKTDQPSSTVRLFLEKPHSPEAEAVQNLYTSIMLSRPSKPPRVILVASASPSEGKTTVSVNLATVLARHGRTCLTETDLRKPAVGPVFGLNHREGLSNVLTGSVPLETAMTPVADAPNLVLLLAGPTPPNPAELLASDAMRELVLSLRQQFEYVVLDSPPIIPFADARSLSALADGVIVVGRCGRTTRQAIVRTTEVLDSAHAHILGFVINGVNLSSPDYCYYQYGSYFDSEGGYKYASEGSGELTAKQEKEEEPEEDEAL